MKYFYNKKFYVLVLLLFSIGITNAQNGQLIITGPAGISGEYDVLLAGFNPCDFESVSGTLALAEDDFGTAKACSADALSGIGGNVNGRIAVMDRGDCPFTHKIFQAQEAGAIAVIICNNVADPAVEAMGGEDEDIALIEIPSMMVSLADCNIIKAEINNNIEVDIERNSVTDVNSDDEVIWGANGEGTFEDGLGDWTTVGITDGAHLWEWIGTSNINSQTQCGSVVFNLQQYQIDDGFDVDNPGPAPYNQYNGELISPSINLSGVNAVALKFYQYNLGLNTETQYATSIDGGTTWSDPIDISSENTQDSDVILTELRRIPLTGVAGESDVMIKFIADGDFFFWGIDDVQIVELTGVNISMGDAFYTPIAYGFPQAHADTDTFALFTSVRNSGGSVLDRIRLDVSITNDDTGEEFFADSGTQSDIAIGAISEVATDNLFVPVGLPIGKYSIKYDLSILDASETDRTDNTITKIFEITENLFTKEPGPLNNGFYTGSRPGGEWAAGAVYRMSKNVTDYVATNAITSISSNQNSLADNFIDVFLVRLTSGLNFADFDFFETDLQGHPSFDIISQNTHVFTDEQNGQLITIPFSSSGQGVPLEPGESYMVILNFDGSQAGSALAPNEELFLGYNGDPRVSFDIDNVGFVSDMVMSKDQGQWFSGFSGDPAPVIRMEVELMSDTDDTPLPAGSFVVYPNPASDYINVELNLDQPSNATIVMAALDGRIIEVKELNNVSKRNLDINVAHLPAGTYLLKAYTDTGSTTHKVVVAH